MYDSKVNTSNFFFYIYRSISKSTDKLEQIHMCWLEVITNGLPPCIIIQGNEVQTVTASA